jgi:hypothetical protein
MDPKPMTYPGGIGSENAAVYTPAFELNRLFIEEAMAAYGMPDFLFR